MPRTPRPIDQSLMTERAHARVAVSAEMNLSIGDRRVLKEAYRRVKEARKRSRQSQIKREIAEVLGAPQTRDLPRRDPLQIVIDALPSIRGLGRFGDRRVFIAALWDVVGRRVGMSLDEFKEWLFEQHRARNLVLARADLVSAMPHEMVMRSEHEIDKGARISPSFHFVHDPSVR